MGFQAGILSLRMGFEPEGWGEDEPTDKQTNKQTKAPCVLQDIVPFGAAAQKKQQPETGRRINEILEGKRRVEEGKRG